MNALYNCCTDGREPDWARFTHLEVGGCIDHDGETEGLVPLKRAQFLTVYGRQRCGEAEAITDIRAMTMTPAVVWALMVVSGLPVQLCKHAKGE